MINPLLKNLDKIEFVITDSCTGNCIHCSQGQHPGVSESINAEIACECVEKICSVYDIKTVMTFGGEPLLYPETVFSIMKTAKRMGVAKRQVITNGYFSENPEEIQNVARLLSECGVNEILLSVDAFHQKTIPLDVVKMFAKELKSAGVPVKLQPAWLVSSNDDNPYNVKTKEIIEIFRNMEIFENDGNIVFPEGNALKYLKEYFEDYKPQNPYVQDPKDVRCVSFSANGDVLRGNVYKQEIMGILDGYKV